MRGIKAEQRRTPVASVVITIIITITITIITATIIVTKPEKLAVVLIQQDVSRNQSPAYSTVKTQHKFAISRFAVCQLWSRCFQSFFSTFFTTFPNLADYCSKTFESFFTHCPLCVKESTKCIAATSLQMHYWYQLDKYDKYFQFCLIC